MDIINPALFVEPDYCTECNTAHSIEMIDFFGSYLKYPSIVSKQRTNKTMPEIFDSKNIYRMVCRNCKKEYIIDWSNGFPVPLRNKYEIAIFKDLFASGK